MYISMETKSTIKNRTKKKSTEQDDLIVKFYQKFKEESTSFFLKLFKKNWRKHFPIHSMWSTFPWHLHQIHTKKAIEQYEYWILLQIFMNIDANILNSILAMNAAAY